MQIKNTVYQKFHFLMVNYAYTILICYKTSTKNIALRLLAGYIIPSIIYYAIYTNLLLHMQIILENPHSPKLYTYYSKLKEFIIGFNGTQKEL